MGPQQVDLTEHAFRSVRGWLHRLFPTETILIEARTDEALTVADATANASSGSRPLWHLKITAGPTWEEHTGLSSKHLLTIEALRNCTDHWDAQRAAGKVVANATRPAGLIPLRAYNLIFPQPPDLAADSTPGSLPALVAVSVAAVDAGGEPVTQPSEPIVVAPGSSSVAVSPTNWPAGAELAAAFHIYAGEPGTPLTKQASILAGSTHILSALAAGTAPPTGRTADMLGIRVTAVDAAPAQVGFTSTPTWDMRATLRLTVQVPRVFAAHLDAALVP